MRQGWKPLSLGVALALCALVGWSAVGPGTSAAHAAGKTATTSSAKSKNAQRQFTGTVVALDKGTLTVEKRGKKPQSRVFRRHAEMKIEGELAKDARVTVYYREEGAQAVAHRVVVKPADSASADR